MLNAQIYDRSFSEAGILLRQSHDLFLLSFKADLQKVLESFAKFKIQWAAWRATSSLILGAPDSIRFKTTKRLNAYLKWFVFMQKHKKSAEIYLTLKYILWRFWRYISMPVRAVFDSSLRAGIMARLTDRKWYSAHIDSYKQFFRPKINLE